MEKSRTQRALELHRQQPTRSFYSISKEVGLSHRVLPRALDVIRQREDAQREQAAQSRYEQD
jgi:hypothetical protein